jgi:hypothetical protein
MIAVDLPVSLLIFLLHPRGRPHMHQRAVMTLKARLAKFPFVIHPMHEMPIGWAPLVGAMSRLATIPITTVTIFVTKITISARFFDFHDRRVALKNA